MTVSDNFRVELRRYSGYTDPALPIAAYIAQGGSVGDASGGSILQSFLFRLGTEPKIERSLMYNLEQLSADYDADVNANIFFRTLNMNNLAPTRVASPEKWSIALRGNNVSDGASELQFMAGLPLWLGSPNSGGSDAGVRFEWENVDLRLVAATIQGYVWGPRSVLAEGGPQRPPNGLFGP